MSDIKLIDIDGLDIFKDEYVDIKFQKIDSSIIAMSNQKAAADGIATLDDNAKIPISQIPTSIKTGAEKSVRFESQSLTDTQKVQAMNNIGGKSYSSSVSDHSGLGKIYLDKNNGVLTQSMVNTANTIYVIQYDYVLNSNITIPSGCILEFDGGCIKGGGTNKNTITGNNTCIYAAIIKIFDNNVVLSGTWNVNEIYPEWFGAKGDGVTDDSSAFINACSIGGSVFLKIGTYLVSQQITCTYGTSIIGKNKQNSIIKTNGITISTHSQLSGFTVKSISKNTQYLVKITTQNSSYNDYLSNIVIHDVDFEGAAFEEYDSQVTGLLVECYNGNPEGLYGVNVVNTEFKNRMLYGIRFEAKGTDAWITCCNFTNIFINNAVYPIEFNSVNTNAFYNFQNIYFNNITAQYNYNSSVTPSTEYTLSFARLSHCSRIIFDHCCCMDAPISLKPYYLKDDYNYLSVVNEGERSIDGLFEKYDGSDWELILSKHVYGVVSSIADNNTIHISSPINLIASNFNNVTVKSLSSFVHNASSHFIGFKMTNNDEIYSQRREMLIGMKDGHIVHSNLTSPNSGFELSDVYSTAYIPTYDGDSDLPSGYGRGGFIYHTGLGSFIYYDSWTGEWKDAMGVRIWKGTLKRIGTTTERNALNIVNFTIGFQFFDTTLNKPVWWTGSGWVDANGISV